MIWREQKSKKFPKDIPAAVNKTYKKHWVSWGDFLGTKFIATNKRVKPTKLILEYLSIGKYFNEIYCPDMHELKFKNKTDLISHILKTNSLLFNETIMIGDTIHDGLAADENKLDFALVEYGYGHHENYKYKLNSINQIINII